MNKWYQTIIVNHKEEEGKLSHWFDDENYKILCEERVEQLKEIERQKEVINGMIDNEEKYLLEINKLKSIIKEVREYIEEKKYSFCDDYDLRCEDGGRILDILDKENKND